MQPVVTPEEMAAIDAEAPEPVEELIERAGWAAARAANQMLAGRLYGARILVLAGKGNNGADGRSAARHLDRWGARCDVVDVFAATTGVRSSRSPLHRSPLSRSPSAGRPHRWDLVIDACLGTGRNRAFDVGDLPIPIGDAPVLAVDIPSGLDGVTGRAEGEPVQAGATVTFAALKPGLLFHPGRTLAGRVEVADIGLDCSRATIHLVEPVDVLTGWPPRSATDHKRSRSILIVGGSPGLTGAPALVASGALRSGTGHVTVSVPGTLDGSAASVAPPIPMEAIEEAIPGRWADAVTDRLASGPPVGAVVLGPGLATDAGSLADVRAYLAATETPTVFDAGALHALAPGSSPAAERPGGPRVGRPPAHALPDDPGPAPDAAVAPDPLPGATTGAVRHVLTPHDGEFRVLTGRLPGPDRIDDCRRAASGLGAVVLLKGPTTVVAHPDGRVLLSTAGDERLATAGSGDVLAGIIASGLAAGLDPMTAAALGAELHGHASLLGYRVGLVAGDIPSLVAEALSEGALRETAHPGG